MRETRSQLSVFEVVPGTDQVERHAPRVLARLLAVLITGVEGRVQGREGCTGPFCPNLAWCLLF